MSHQRDLYVLPGGYIDESGALHREAELCSLSGREEELLASRNGKESAALVTALLRRCVRRIGAISPVPEDVARSLLVADRQYLLLRLRCATFGGRVQAGVPCPWPDCGKPVDIDFTLDDLPVRESKEKGPLFTMLLSPEAAVQAGTGEDAREIVFRLPNGSDQEAVSEIINENEAKALTLLLSRCIQRIGSIERPGEKLIEKLSPLARREIERRMEETAPRVDLDLAAGCPECGREFTIPFDLQDFFFGELRTSLDLLYREVHYLAYHYHWSEREIMEMPREKRQSYIGVLTDEIERLNNAVS